MLYWRLSWIRLIICVYIGMSCAFMLFVNIIFCKLVISVFRSLAISGLLHLQYRWLSESGCWLQSGHIGKSWLCELVFDDCEEDCIEYLCFVYALGSGMM